jgi:hypothetical protein
MFGDKSSKEGGSISTVDFEYAKSTNDTPKENHLMCPGCENDRLGSLESYIAKFFYHSYRNPKYAANFPVQKWFNQITKELDCLRCDTLHVGLFKLYIYSLVWRASVASVAGFQYFKLDAEIEEMLRNTLDTFLKDKAKDTADFYDANVDSFPQLPFIIVTPIEQADVTSNLTTPPIPYKKDEVAFFMNEFMIIFHTKWNPAYKFDRVFNPGPYPIHIGLAPEKEWKSLTTRMLHHFRDAYFSNHAEKLKTQMPKGFSGLKKKGKK